MISFECAHCGNEFRVEANLAGRYGWCRVCKGLIIVPGKDEAPFGEWESDEKIKKLESILRQAGLRQERDGRYIRRMKKKMESDEAGDERIVELREKIKELRGRLEIAESHHSEVISKLEESGAERGALGDKLEHLRADNIKLNDSLLASESALTEAREATAAANESIERLRHELASRDGGEDASALQAEIDGLAEARDSALRDLEHTRAEIRELESAQQAALDEKAELDKALALARSEVETAEARVQSVEAERETDQEAITKLADESEALRQQVAHQEGELETLRKAIIRAKEEVDRLEGESSEHERTVADRDSLRAQLQESETARAALAEKLGQAEARAEAADDHRSEAQGRLDSALEKVARLTEEIVTAVPAIVHDDKAPAVADMSGISEMKTFIEEANEARREADRRADGIERDLAHAQEKNEEMAARLAEQDTATQDLTVVQARLDESQEQVRELTRELASLSKQVAELESDGRQKDQEIGRLRNQIAGIDTDDSPARASVEWPVGEDDGGTLMPDLLAEDDDDDMLTDSLLRFIQPE